MGYIALTIFLFAIIIGLLASSLRTNFSSAKGFPVIIAIVIVVLIIIFKDNFAFVMLLAIFGALLVVGILAIIDHYQKKNGKYKKKTSMKLFCTRFDKKDDTTLTYSYRGHKYEELTMVSYEGEIKKDTLNNATLVIILGTHLDPESSPRLTRYQGNILRLKEIERYYYGRVVIEKTSKYSNCVETITIIPNGCKTMIPLLAYGEITVDDSAEKFLAELVGKINELAVM